MMSPAARIALRLAFFYGAIFASIGVFLPFWPVWLESRGLSPAEIGLILGASFWPRIVTSLMIPNAADRLGKRRFALILLTSSTLIGLLAFPLVGDFWLFMALSLITGATWSSIMPIAEAISLDHVGRHGLDYGRVRLWGSITFICMSIGGGFFVERAGAPVIFVLLIGATALTLTACFTMPDSKRALSGSTPARLGSLFRRRDLWVLVIASALIQSSHALLYNFGSIHWRNAGLGETVIGWLWAEGVIVEVLVFMGGAALIRMAGLKRLLVIAGILTVVRWALNGLSADLPLLIVTQALHGASFALTFLATLHYLRDTTPQELQASAQGFYAAIGFAPLFGIVTPLSGLMYAQVAGGAFFAMAALAAAGTLLALALPPVEAKASAPTEASAPGPASRRSASS